MKKRYILFTGFIVLSLLVGCGQIPAIPTEINININGAETQENVGDIVAATFQAMTAQAGGQPQQTFTPIPTLNAPSATTTSQPAPNASTGSISGALSFPSQGIPPLLVVAFNKQSGYNYWMMTTQNQSTYQLDNLPPGIYNIIAYTMDGLFKGAFDQFYLCGLSQGCNDHTLVDVSVQAGFVTPNINPGDWYVDPATLPAMPSINGTDNIPTNTPPGGLTGSIAGSLNYPASGIPSLVVVAFGSQPNEYYYVITNTGQSTYQIDNLPLGTYTVVAYSANSTSYAAGYSQAVPCGLQYTCTDHSLISVQVKANQLTSGVNPQDWYAPPGTFPAYPLP